MQLAKLRKRIDENPVANYILRNGPRPQIKRRLFEQYSDEHTTAIKRRNSNVEIEPVV